MNVLITGRNGFLAKELSENFSDFEITCVGRQEVDLTDSSSVESLFRYNKFDAVIHTAITGGRRDSTDTFQTFVDNISMFNNLIANKHLFGKLINFCSGAAFGRGTDIYEYHEHRIYGHLPGDPYGMSKNIIARECWSLDDVYNLRLFGCFGFHEADSRFIKSSIIKSLNGQPIVVHKNRSMDFVSSEDVATVVRHYLENDLGNDYNDINVCYKKKQTLRNIAAEIVSLTNSKSDILLEDNSFGCAYTGCSKKLDSLNLDLQGMKTGLENLTERLSE
jgi:UDP-glucose 4-epimerase